MNRLRLGVLFLAIAPALVGGQEPYATDKDVAKWIAKWQKRLDLEGWKIDGRIARAFEMRPDTLGQTDWVTGTRTAQVMVLDGLEFAEYSRHVRYDQELTVVHELVHLRLTALRPSAPVEVEEGVVVALSEALFGRRAKR